MTTHSGAKKLAHVYGPETDLAWVRWAPSSSATQTLTEAHGVSSITRTGSLAELITLANELRTDYTNHLVQRVHLANDATNVVATANATDLATGITLGNALKAAYNLHRSQSGVHTVNDAGNAVSSSNATDQSSLNTLLNEMKGDFNSHRTAATVHDIDDDKNVVSTADATDLSTSVALVNAIKAAYNLHLSQLAHKVVDSTNVLTLSACTNLTTAIALLNELRTVYAAHRVSTTHHDAADSTNTVASSACTNRETAVTLANQLKTAYVAHRTQASVHPTNDDLNNVTSVLNVAGCYRLNMRQKGGTLFPIVGYIENDTTKFHFLDVVAIDAANGWVDVRHRDCAFASVAAEPAASDTVDEIVALVFQPKGTTLRSGAKHRLRAFGPKVELAYARWAPSGSATQTLTEAHGVKRVTRTGAGAWTVTLDSSCKAMVALIGYVENDTTHYHFAEVTATTASSGTFTARHRSVAYASVASGPSASDTVDQIEVLVLKRMAT